MRLHLKPQTSVFPFFPDFLPSFLQTLDGGLNVIQLETAVGAAIKSFENSLGINVPRSRFLPVKTTSDLLLVMSNLYSLNAGSLTMSEKREFPTVPLVKLGSSFTKVGIGNILRELFATTDFVSLYLWCGLKELTVVSVVSWFGE